MDESISDPPPASVAPPQPSSPPMPLRSPAVPRVAAPMPSTPSSTRGDPIARLLAEGLPLAEARQRLIDEFESRYIEHLIEQHDGNVTRAAAAAGIARRHLQRLRAKQRG
jgi:DNA-binding NtrC family response regulator